MNKINFDSVITDLAGEVVKQDTKDAKDTDLKYLAVIALTSGLEEDKNLSGKDKFELGVLAQEVYAGGEIELSSEDVSTLKDRIGKMFGPLFVLRSYELLDPKS